MFVLLWETEHKKSHLGLVLGHITSGIGDLGAMQVYMALRLMLFST